MAEVDNSLMVRDQLDSMLSELYDFGDDFVTPKMNICENWQHEEHSIEKETEKVNEDNQPPILCSKRGRKNVSLFFDSIKDELCSQPKCTDFPSSSASKHQVEVVTYVSRRDKKQTNGTEVQDRDSEINVDVTEEERDETFNFEKARLEVHKFGITGYKKEKQRKFEQERAIMLGARPPKREYVNYKVYQERIKEQEQTRKEKRFKENGTEPVKKKRKEGQNHRGTRKAKVSGKVPSGQVGRFRDGALILSGKDIQKIKQSKVIK
ncbi:40S small subunit processome assembly factor 1 [Mixophyes fleayi]|uniref:40S small subunit processome assembly factor 1 n=1 Tax=Mixophyes fleayi TaxID=3061075 RepID=UPI003F4E444A